MNSFKISDVLHESWDNLRGVKWPIWAIMLTAFFVAATTQVVLIGIGFKMYGKPIPLIWNNLIIPILSDIVIGFFICGFVMPAIKKLRGESFTASTGFEYFRRAPQAMTFMLLVGGINAILLYLSEVMNKSIGTNQPHLGWLEIIAMVIGLIIMVFCYLTIPLIADKKETVFQAIGNSIRLVGRHWYKVLAILITVYALMIIAAIPLLVGLLFHHPLISMIGALIMLVAIVWLLPYIVMLQANLYLKLAGPKQGG